MTGRPRRRAIPRPGQRGVESSNPSPPPASLPPAGWARSAAFAQCLCSWGRGGEALRGAVGKGGSWMGPKERRAIARACASTARAGTASTCHPARRKAAAAVEAEEEGEEAEENEACLSETSRRMTGWSSATSRPLSPPPSVSAPAALRPAFEASKAARSVRGRAASQSRRHLGSVTGGVQLGASQVWRRASTFSLAPPPPCFSLALSRRAAASRLDGRRRGGFFTAPPLLFRRLSPLLSKPPLLSGGGHSARVISGAPRHTGLSGADRLEEEEGRPRSPSTVRPARAARRTRRPAA
mmetsp:Transcript_50160/g.113825  ORF Transcript_50160/g.113825 Transcript_50160/m.113825 type:complete len:297 (-) Transcript_50160:957-1847(-)